MKLPTFKHSNKLPYSQMDIADQLGDLSDIIIKREKALQLSILEKSDIKQQKRLEEVDSYDDLIGLKQEILRHMLEKNLGRIRRV